MRTIRYRQIADDLRDEIVAGALSAGAVLPSESDLAAVHDVSRVTVRKALDLLRDEGLIDARQGFGWFVAAPPVLQRLAELATIEGQLADEGLASVRQVLSFGFVDAPPRARAVLGVDEVLEVTRRNLADDVPFALVTVWCPAELGASFSRADVERQPFYELLDVDLGGATQTIGAGLADARTSEALGVPVGSPVLVCERISRDLTGAAVLVSVHRFPAHLTEFVVELPSPPASLAPSGLRLVE